MTTTYSTRSAARRAAQVACRKALNAPGFIASEGPDYVIHPQSATLEDMTERGHYRERYSFELMGPAAEAAK